MKNSNNAFHIKYKNKEVLHRKLYLLPFIKNMSYVCGEPVRIQTFKLLFFINTFLFR